MTASPSRGSARQTPGTSPLENPRCQSRFTLEFVVNTAEAAIDAATAGLGITRVLSYQIANAVRAGTLTLALQKFESAPWPVSLVHAGQRLLPLKLRAFIDFAYHA